MLRIKNSFKYLIFTNLIYILPLSAQVGNWTKDELDLPAFSYTGSLPYVYSSKKEVKKQKFETVAASANNNRIDSGQAYLPEDPYFILGNYRMTVFVHASGNYQIINGERAWGRLNSSNEPDKGFSEAIIEIDGNQFKLTELLAQKEVKCTERRFGMGYASFTYSIPAYSIELTRVLSVLPSKEINEGISAINISVSIKNKGKKKSNIKYSERISASYEMLSMRKKMSYETEIIVNPNKPMMKARFVPANTDAFIVRDEKTASWYDIKPSSLYMYCRQPLASVSEVKDSDKFKKLQTSTSFLLNGNSENSSSFVVGYVSSDSSFQNIDNQIVEINKINALGITKEQSVQLWSKRLPLFPNEKDSILRREMIWNAYSLECMATYSEYYKCTYIPQGTMYVYQWGMDGAIRDMAQHGLAACYYNPALAKSILHYIMQQISTDGEIKYTQIGYGIATNYLWKTSDQQLYFFLLLSTYLKQTKDFNFLLEQSPYYPRASQHSGTALEKIEATFLYLRDEISVGSHGIIRILNSDWNDSFFHQLPINKYYFKAESHFNSALALCTMDDLIDMLNEAAQKKEFNGQKAYMNKLGTSMKKYTTGISESLFKDLGAKNYSPRAYLDENTLIGDTNLYVEPQGFLLKSPLLSLERKKAMYNYIKPRLMDGEVLGARQMELADHKFEFEPNYSRENGGFWIAVYAPVIEGVSSFDKPESKRLLRNLTFHNFSKNYPDVWQGQWTQADCMNSSKADQPGLPGRLAWSTFSAYCAHAHAWPLYLYYKLNEK